MDLNKIYFATKIKLNDENYYFIYHSCRIEI